MSAPLDIDQLQTFIAIVDTGSFTKAAGRVFKTQSAVSMQMRRLEERVGKQLFIKDGRGNRLTADGDKLLNYARRIIRLNSEAIAAFDDNRLEGTLRIGTPDDYADRYMPEIIGRFAKTHPQVELYIVCEPSVDLAEKMAKGELDMAKRLVEDMSGDWQPDDYRDSFEDKIMALVEKKAHAGKIENIERVSDDEPRKSADVIDLTELLKRSLGAKAGKKPAKTSGKPAPTKKPRKAAGD